MSQNYNFYDNRTQNVNSDQTSLAATLMSRPTSITTNTFTSGSASRTTHSIENSQNNNISSSSNINTASHKKSLNNPALVKRKHYSKKYVKEMKNCNSLVFGLAIASLSVVFYIFGAIHFTLLLIDSEENLRHNNTLPIIFISICLVMSIVSCLLIVGIVKREPIFFFIMRLNLKAVLLLLTVAVVVITCAVYMRCAEFTFPNDLVKRWDRKLYAVGGNTDLLNNNLGEGIGGAEGDGSDLTPLQDIECLINQEYTIRCKRDEEDHEVYVPFSFIRNYFDISGSMSNPGSPQAIEGNNEVQAVAPKFMWMHSTAKINLPKGKYDPRGLFMYFENYNVEVRDRVKCISAADGVPISTQWEKRGYFYPTQIAQFALSHYSKNLTEPEPRIRILENADIVQNSWSIPKSSNLTRKWHPKFNSSVIQYETAIDFHSAITLNNIDQILDLVLNIDLLLITNSSSLMVTVENHETKRTYRVHYIPADLLLSVQDENIYYGLGLLALNKWRHLTRDLHIDVQKGLAMESPKKSGIKIKRSELRVVSISLMGIGFFDNITLSTYNHLAHFYDAAEWFVNNQDLRTGGWPNPVRRSLNGFAELRSGWLSAMGQGHAISVLARAYWHSGGDKRYLKAASLGLKPYRVFSKDGGVLAQFMDKYYWYEEYPTTPASFVLNGFIYSLLGLYDLNSTAPSNIANEAGKLFNQGMISLKKMLLLYDTGSGTSYDLRHLSLGVAPNLARWDYHATHVNQLLLLATIDSDPIITQTAERWKGYMFGKRAKHN